MAKIDGELIYELESEILGANNGWERESEDVQQNYKELAKKIEDYLVYGLRCKKD